MEEVNEEESNKSQEIAEEHGASSVDSMDISALPIEDPNSPVKSSHEFNEDEVSLDNYLSSIIHDFRTPLQCISLMLEKLQQKNLNNHEKTESINIAQTNTMLIENYVNDILDLKQMKQGKINIVVEKFSLDNLVKDLKKSMETLASLKGIQIKIDNQLDNQKQEIISDQRRLKQIIINLFSNSIKFTAQGTIEIKFHNTFGNFIKFFIKDTGCGIKKDVIPLLTTPFQTFNTNGLNKQGVGLGLYFCKKIIGQLGPEERLTIESTIGAGSIFSFKIYANIQKLSFERNNEIIFKSSIFITDSSDEKFSSSHTMFSKSAGFRRLSLHSQLVAHSSQNSKYLSPDSKEHFQKNESQSLHGINPASESKTKQTHSQNLINTSSNHSIQMNQTSQIVQIVVEGEHQFESIKLEIFILLVDDSPFNLMIAENYLNQIQGYSFTILKANNGLEAIEIYQAHNFEPAKNNIKIILMDCQMPICTGYEAAIVINEFVMKQNFVKAITIAHTGYQDSQIEEYQECQFDGILNKPSSFHEFSEYIIQLIQLLQTN